MRFWAVLILTFFVVLLLAEVSPEAVNALLILILLGIILGRGQDIAALIGTITSIAEGG